MSEDMKFSSKSKREYNELLNKPLYISSSIRIKFPNDELLQFEVTPYETVDCIYQLVK